MERKNLAQNILGGLFSLTFPSLNYKPSPFKRYRDGTDREKIHQDYRRSLVGISNEVRRFEQRLAQQ